MVNDIEVETSDVDYNFGVLDFRRKIQAEDKDLGNHQHLVCNEALNEDKIIQDLTLESVVADVGRGNGNEFCGINLKLELSP